MSRTEEMTYGHCVVFRRNQQENSLSVEKAQGNSESHEVRLVCGCLDFRQCTMFNGNGAGIAHTSTVVARAIWKGELKLGTLTVPVKLYSAVQDQTVRFHMIQSKTKSRVKQQMLTESHQHIESEKIRKAYETESGTFVVL